MKDNTIIDGVVFSLLKSTKNIINAFDITPMWITFNDYMQAVDRLYDDNYFTYHVTCDGVRDGNIHIIKEYNNN